MTVKFYFYMELSYYTPLGHAFAHVLAMMNTTTFDEQSIPVIFHDTRRPGMWNRFMRFRYDLQLKFSVRPAILILTVCACVAAWGIAAIFTAIVA